MAQTKTQIGTVMQAGPQWQARMNEQNPQVFKTEGEARNYFSRDPRSNTKIGGAIGGGAGQAGRIIFEETSVAPKILKVFLFVTTP